MQLDGGPGFATVRQSLEIKDAFEIGDSFTAVKERFHDMKIGEDRVRANEKS